MDLLLDDPDLDLGVDVRVKADLHLVDSEGSDRLVELDLSKLPEGMPHIASFEVKFDVRTEAYRKTKSAPARLIALIPRRMSRLT